MRDVQSFLYLLLVFKLHEDTMNVKFTQMSELEKRIQETLKSSVEKILDDGAAQIGAGMEKAYGEYRSLRGQVILVCFICVMTALAYQLGASNFLARTVSSDSFLDALLHLPAGWSVFFCGATYTFLWVGDHWKQVKRKNLFKALLGLQIFLLLVIALSLL